MHTRHKQTTNHGVSFHNELQKQTLQNIVFQQFILLKFPMLQIYCINKEDHVEHQKSNIVRANKTQFFFNLI